MKLKSIFLITIIFLFLIITNSRRLKTKSKKAPIFELMSAKGNYTNDNAQHQFFDNGVLLKSIEITKDTDYATVIGNYEELAGKDMTLKRIKIYNRDLSFPAVAKHEFLMVCAVDKSYDYYFVIDRSRHGSKDETKIRIIYTGRENKYTNSNEECYFESKQWAENRGIDPNTKESFSYLLNGRGLLSESIKFQILIEALIKYANKYPYYSLLAENCQHFATGIYNALTGDSKEISNKDFVLFCKSDINHDDLLTK